MLSFVSKDENEELQIEDVTDEVIESLKTSYTIKFHLLQIPRLYSYSFSSGLKSSPNALKYYENNEMIVKTETDRINQRYVSWIRGIGSPCSCFFFFIMETETKLIRVDFIISTRISYSPLSKYLCHY